MFGGGIWWWLLIGGLALTVVFLLTGQTIT
jgi:hypothetical protein